MCASDELLRHFRLDPEHKIENLSRGMNLTRAGPGVGTRPELLILDEPTAGLDVLVRRNFLESVIDVIQREGRTVLFSSHLVHEVERVADHVVIIEAGRLVTSMPPTAFKESVKRTRRSQRRASRTSGASPACCACGRPERKVVLTVRDFDEKTKVQVQGLGAEIRAVEGTSLEEAFVELLTAGSAR